MPALPSVLRVKRKADEISVDQLYLKGQTGEAQDSPNKRPLLWQYQLQPTVQTVSSTATQNATETNKEGGWGQEYGQCETAPREFRLVAKPGATRKRKAGEADIATFVEAKRWRPAETQDGLARQATHAEREPSPRKKAPLKRPGAGARKGQGKAEEQRKAVRNQSQTEQNKAQSDKLAEALHKFALESIAQEASPEKPRLTARPKAPALRYRDRHPESFTTSPAKGLGDSEGGNVDIDMSDDEGYVYDTYVRYQHPVVPASLDPADPANGQFGFIVITEQDEEIWETYFEDEDSDDDANSDEEDENGTSSCLSCHTAAAYNHYS